MTDRNNEFKRDETRNTDNGFIGDGCHNCCHNPKFVNMRKKVGKPKVSIEVFDEEVKHLENAYNVDMELEMRNVYWQHLAYTILDDEEFKDAIYHCIDEYSEFPPVSEILEMGIRLKMLQK